MKTDEKITAILKEISGAETVRPDSRLLEELALDSLGMVMLLVELEEAFQIELEASDMNPFDLVTVGDVVRLVNRYCGDSHENGN